MQRCKKCMAGRGLDAAAGTRVARRELGLNAFAVEDVFKGGRDVGKGGNRVKKLVGKAFADIFLFHRSKPKGPHNQKQRADDTHSLHPVHDDAQSYQDGSEAPACSGATAQECDTLRGIWCGAKGGEREVQPWGRSRGAGAARHAG